MSADSTSTPEDRPVSLEDSTPPRGNPFPVVGIGASAGGLEAFNQLLGALSTSSGMAFVLVQHLDPNHESQLPELLTPSTSMPIVRVENGIHIEPNKVYVIPPNATMVMEDSRLLLARRESGLHLPIDIFFESLAEVQGSRAIGVVLSGNASDGSQGLRAIKAECGLTFAQDEATATFGGMPRSAIATGAVDYVLSPAEIGRELGRLGHHPFLLPVEPEDATTELLPDGDGDMRRIFALLANNSGVDFSHYKPTTVRRRISRRMMVLRLDTLPEYVYYLDKHPKEIRDLYRDLLISVTSFFRDPEAFESLSTHFRQRLTSESRRDDAVRIWVPGCATGEEVYSIAICFLELLGDLEMAVPLQIFGTDISEVALDRARQGFYSENITKDISSERLRRYFHRIDSGYQIAKIIRESCIFARHDVTKDPPFSRVDLVSCRNLLIYLDAGIQRRVFPIFHYALKPDGILFLGGAESTGPASDLFNTVDKQNNLYQRKAGSGILSVELRPHIAPVAYPLAPSPSSPGTDLQKRLDRVIQSKYAPDAVLVDSNMQILQFRGHTRPYLDPAPGGASLNLLRMAHESLVVPLRRILQAASEAQHSVRESGVVFQHDGITEEIAIEVTPVAGESLAERLWLVVFIAQNRYPGELSGAEESHVSSDEGSRIVHLERELAETREHLRNMTEEFEAHSEELRAANEEARSANEELQSTNEELGTTKEELQSANEELTTINEELQHRNIELNNINSDLRNLFAAVGVAVLMVDADLRIRRYNPAAEKLLDLEPIDIGRPIGHLRSNIPTPFIENQIRQVIDTLHADEQHVQDREGRWFSVVSRPYRTVDDRIMGAVVTVQDIHLLKRGLELAEEARDYAEGMIETVREPLLVLDADLRVQLATASFYEVFQVSREETIGRFIYNLGNGQWNQPRLRELIGAALFHNQPFYDYEVETDFPHIGHRTMRLNGRRILREDAGGRTLLLSLEDVSQRREAAEIRFLRLFETAKDAVVVVDAETGVVTDVNPCLLETISYPREHLIGRKLLEIAPFAQAPEMGSLFEDLSLIDTVRIDDVRLRRSDGCVVDMELVANRYKVGGQPVVQLNLRDITQRKEHDAALRRSVEEKALLVREIHHRVKNNLQVIVSLLSLQASYTKDPKAIAGFEEAEGRVRAMAQIHETLHTSPDLTEIEFSAYLASLVRDLIKLHGTVHEGIELHLHVEEMVLDMETAIPLGLIANEVIVNSLKHGLKASGGRLEVSLSYGHDGAGDGERYAFAQLRIADSGPGFPEGIHLPVTQSMGMRILYLLSKQIQASVEFPKGPGAIVLLTFPLIPKTSLALADEESSALT